MVRVCPMAIKGKPLRQELVRTGDPDDWLEKVEDAFASAGFTKIRADPDACVCSGNFHKGTVWGELEVELDDASRSSNHTHKASWG